ncbi:hypothetical protein HHI36_015954 [Cryptolaemus montrouzieri]|uniref:HIT-type domain-containing protein n=1 Tax=Cryptolaemus montrouzieri TaxID=559131 RepID=A0ABD2N7X9_9CUCU
MLKCEVCNNPLEKNYKCPTCLIKYCSNQCYKKHKEQCTSNLNNQSDDPTKVESRPSENKSSITSRQLVPLEKLESLRHDKSLQELLENPHLRNLLKTINESDIPEDIMQKAMQEPLFTEFADVCLKKLDPPSDNET